MKYGEENAKYLWETLHPESNNNELIFIDMPEISSDLQTNALENIAKQNNKKIRILNGNMRIIKNLIDGNWNDKDFLIVPPKIKIKATYDYDNILTL